MLPTFLIIGAQKCGTSSLFHHLSGHPDVYLPAAKEIDFFSDPGWFRGLAWYEGVFAASGGAAAVGEASPSYTVHPHAPEVPERIASVLPGVKLIYLLRDPIARMRSAYLHALSEGVERRPIGRALLEDPLYLDHSRYALQIDRYLQVFDRDQLLLLTLENLRDHPREVLGRVCDFIGVDPTWRPPDLDLAYNSARDHLRAPLAPWRYLGHLVIAHHLEGLVPDVLLRLNRRQLLTRAIHPGELTVDPDLRARLLDLLRPDLLDLRDLLDQDFDAWGLLSPAVGAVPAGEAPRGS